MRLTAKLNLLLGALALSVLLPSLGLLYRAERRHLQEQSEEAIVEGIEKMARVCADSLLSDNELSRLAYLRTFWESASPPPDSVALVDEGGRVLLHSDWLKEDPGLLRESLADFQRQDAGLTRRALSDPFLGKAMRSEMVLRQEVLGPKKKLWVISVPSYVRGRKTTLAAVYDKAAIDRSIDAMQRGTALRFAQSAGLGVALSALFAFLIARALTRPLKELRRGAQQIGQGEFGRRIPERGKDELGELARAFNRMGERLAELDELKDSFLAKVTHDLRAPLHAMVGHIDLLLLGSRGKVGRRQAQSLRAVRSNARFLGELIGNILDLTRIEAGRLELSPQPVDLRQSADMICRLLRPRARQLQVAIDCLGVPPGTRVVADPQSLQRVLTNLASNALKFSPKGGRVSLSWARGPSGEDVLSVSDAGPGIPKERIPSLFGKFYQVPETRGKARGAPGVGLGLAICKELVEAHGGRIWVQSAWGRGTTVSFAIPPAR